MKNKVLAALLVIGIIFSLAACEQQKNILHPGEDESLTFKTTSLIYKNGGYTTYSLGGVDSL